MFKRCLVVMLPTNKKATSKDICLNRSYGHLTNPLVWGFDDLDGTSNNHLEVQYLYILSDEKIEEGDWMIHFSLNGIPDLVTQCTGTLDIKSQLTHRECVKYADLYQPKGQYKMIIATTNPFVTGYDDDGQPMDRNGNIVSPLPSPSPLFIQKYVSEYNKGNIITDVMVEYNTYPIAPNGNIIGTNSEYPYENLVCDFSIKYSLKVNPKDNTITIKKLKDSWSRDEVTKLCQDAMILGVKAVRKGFEFNEAFLDFLNKNEL